MKKSFLNSFFYRLAGRISKLMRDFQQIQDKKVAKSENEFWNKLFNGKDYFEHILHNGIKINLYKNSVLSKLIYFGFEKDEIDYVESILDEGDIFIDIGANIGLFTLFAARAVGNTGKVICFEPSPITYTRLEENIRLNNFKNIDYRNIGVSDKVEELVFFVSITGYDAWNSFALREDILEDNILVSVSPLEIELKEVDKTKIKLVKSDVEGWEKFVLHGGRDFFINFSPIVMIEFTEENTFNAGYPVYEIYDIMKDYGYVWYTIKDGELVLEPKKLRYPYNNLIAIKAKTN